jgi:molecular chaperone HtpG
MAAPSVHVDRGPQEGEPLQGQVVVGKDILELLSTAMYLDPLSILREYVQNSADSIDSAYAQGVLVGGEEGRIDLEIHSSTRDLVVRDNGVGIPAAEVEQVLASFGASRKRGKGLRGFRGVGRLGGLGYARALAFRTRASGESEVTEIRWDCRELRDQLASADTRDLVEVVRSVVTVRRMKAVDQVEPHFFEVRLEGVVRLWNDRLLNAEGVSQYLSQVCPLPFSDDLPFKAEIESHLGRYLTSAPFRIYLNGAAEPISRPYRDDFLVSSTKRDRFVSYQLLEFPGLDGKPAAAGWILHHNYLGAIKGTPTIHGLRARVGDMQVGDQQIFSNSFPESRFNSWVVGELHVLDPRILPNGRRDDFEHSATYGALTNQLVPLCRDLARRCRASSTSRSRLLRFEQTERRVKEQLRAIRLRLTADRSPRTVLREVDQLLRQMASTAESALFADVVTTELQRRLKRLFALRRRIGETDYPVSDEAQVPAGKRRTYAEVVRLVTASAPTKRIADGMLRKIGRLMSRKDLR